MSKKPAKLLLCLFGAWALLLAFGTTPVGGDAAPAPEYKVKAAFLYNFAQFIEWPGDAVGGNGPIILAVVGDNPFGTVLDDAARGKAVGGHPLIVRHYPNLQALGPAHILFVSASEENNAEAVLQRAGNATLTVSDFDSFTSKGGMFRFFLEDNKIHFEVNVEAVRKSRLKVSSKLMKLAKVYGQ
jgi:hypothetical protein